ncbi:unnamed protein product [Ceratitis capitata]|uniref:(Mediterranean fruit fly) hypothetical protein n=1 Tax=Ceratitis capitata TaxID=7213 RepID=A0A811UM42_CERCA|nr:unnamed protein product [Ceratitis capitata]
MPTRTTSYLDDPRIARILKRLRCKRLAASTLARSAIMDELTSNNGLKEYPSKNESLLLGTVDANHCDEQAFRLSIDILFSSHDSLIFPKGHNDALVTITKAAAMMSRM